MGAFYWRPVGKMDGEWGGGGGVNMEQREQLRNPQLSLFKLLCIVYNAGSDDWVPFQKKQAEK